MARAKRTARADARRRYRAATDPGLDTDLDGTDEAPDPRPSSRTAQASTKPDSSPVRPGVLNALRIAVHPPNFRDDLAVLPSLVTHPALWLPVLITVLGASVIAVAGVSQASTAGFLGFIIFQYFLFPPSLGGPFIAGFFAPRASWLLGGIVGLVSALCYSTIIVAFPLQVAAKVPDAATARAAVIAAFILSPIMGALIASAAAWYRRFLRLSGPNRVRQTASQRRGNDGRTRGSNGSQKAGARR